MHLNSKTVSITCFNSMTSIVLSTFCNVPKLSCINSILHHVGTKKLPEMHYTDCNITKGGNVGRIIVSGNVSALYICVHHFDIWYAHMYFALRLQQEFKIEFVHFFTYVIDCILCYFILYSCLSFQYVVQCNLKITAQKEFV